MATPDVLPEIEAANTALAAGQHEEALQSLLAAWRGCRSPLLGDAVVLLSERMTAQRPPIEGKTIKARDLAWHQLADLGHAADQRPNDLGVLLPPLTDGNSKLALERLKVLAAWPPDPRISRRLLDTVADVPFQAKTTGPFWTQLFKLLLEHADPTTVARLEELAGNSMERVNAQSTAFQHDRRIIGCLNKIDKAWQKTNPVRGLSNDENAALETLTALMEALPAPGDERSVDSFLAEIAAHPEDDDLRLVFADWLQEKGDPWGEFISLQYQSRERELTPSERRRENGLLSKHRKTWLGPLANVVLQKEVGFERGFLAVCAPGRNATGGKLAKVVDDPRWATVRELHNVVPPWHDFVRGPALPSLRAVVGIAMDPGLNTLWDKEKRPWEKLHLYPAGVPHAETTLWNAKNLERIGNSRGLPNLRSLSFSFVYGRWKNFEDPTALRPLWSSPLLRRLDLFGVAPRNLESCAPWWQEIQDYGDDFNGTLELRQPGMKMVFERDDEDHLSRLSCCFSDATAPWRYGLGYPTTEGMASFLDAMPADALTFFAFDGPSEMVDGLKDGLARQTRLTETQLPEPEKV